MDYLGFLNILAPYPSLYTNSLHKYNNMCSIILSIICIIICTIFSGLIYNDFTSKYKPTVISTYSRSSSNPADFYLNNNITTQFPLVFKLTDSQGANIDLSTIISTLKFSISSKINNFYQESFIIYQPCKASLFKKSIYKDIIDKIFLRVCGIAGRIWNTG